MSDHYYTKTPHSKSDEHTWTTQLGEFAFELTTDSGVFSKMQVDYGSKVLMQASADTNFVSGPLLDLGCGYGPIGLFLARTFPERVIHQVDINERAVALTQKNAQQNNITNVQIYQSNIYSQVSEQHFAGIIVNPPIRAGKKIVHQMISEAADHLVSGGRLLLVIQKKQGAPSAKKKMQEVFGQVERIALDKGYWVLESVKQ